MNILNTRKLPWAQRYPKKFLLLFSLITIAIYQCYSLLIFNSTITKSLNIIVMICLMIYLSSLIFTSRKSIPFFNTIRFIIIIILLSIISCWLMNGQSVALTFTVVSRGVLSIIVFFLMCKLKPDSSILEKYILIFAFLYILLWLYGMSQAPIPITGSADSTISDNRGLYRINFTGISNLVIAFFLSLNKYVILKKRIWLTFTIIFFIFIFLQVTRQLIMFSFLVGVGYYFRKNIKKCILIVISCFLIFQFVSVSIGDDSIMGALINETKEQVEQQENQEDDIRVKEYIYFFTDYNTNFITMIFGNGADHKTSKFGKKVDYIQQTRAYYLGDVGYAAMYGMLGILGLVAYCLLFYKGAMSKINENLMYARLYFIFMIPAHIAAAWFMLPEYAIILAICAYLFVYDSRYKFVDNKNQIALP